MFTYLDDFIQPHIVPFLYDIIQAYPVRFAHVRSHQAWGGTILDLNTSMINSIMLLLIHELNVDKKAIQPELCAATLRSDQIISIS